MANPAGLIMHRAIYAARRDMVCIIHTHTISGSAVSAQKHGILPISQYSLMFYNRVSYLEYDGIISPGDDIFKLVKKLGGNKTMVLNNHGLLTGGRTAAEAFFQIRFLERACQIQVQALSIGCELIIPKEDVCKKQRNNLNLMVSK